MRLASLVEFTVYVTSKVLDVLYVIALQLSVATETEEPLCEPNVNDFLLLLSVNVLYAIEVGDEKLEVGRSS